MLTLIKNANLVNEGKIYQADVLIENQRSSNPEYFFGRTPFMQSVYIKSQKVIPGEVKSVNISTCNHKNLYASC